MGRQSVGWCSTGALMGGVPRVHDSFPDLLGDHRRRGQLEGLRKAVAIVVVMVVVLIGPAIHPRIPYPLVLELTRLARALVDRFGTIIFE